jgi:hypothetical protein
MEMKKDDSPTDPRPENSSLSDGTDGENHPDSVCPVCGEKVVQEKCKVICRSTRCVYRIIYTCAEF